jgi:hypothetical protein
MHPFRSSATLLVFGVAILLAGCGTAAPPSAAPSSTATTTSPSASPGAASTASVAPIPSDTAAPETGGGTTSGDIPDNAVFLTYHGVNPTFSIQYVEGWQVSPQAGGVVIRDKDSSETVLVVAAQPDIAGYVANTDIPALEAQAGFKLVKQDTVKVGSSSYVHLAYNALSAADPVTGKQVPSSVDRYYVPGVGGLAIVSLSTPNGVDNVDAFRQMIQSFAWR